MLTKFRKPPISLLFSIILLNLYKEEKEEKKKKNNLNFRIINERDKDENIKRLDIKRLININELFTFKAMISIRFTNSDIKSSLK